MRCDVEHKKIEDIAEVMELVTCTPFARKIRCRLCGDTVFQINDYSSQSEIDAETVRMTAHMSIQHQILVGSHKCSDQNCVD
jgi:hypothetical protein